MTSVEEALIDRINYLMVGLENCLKEVNLLHQRLNILAMRPMEPIFPQEIGTWRKTSLSQLDGMTFLRNLL
ncbi:hypothetical protein Hanom_Chr11g01063681 [Helianthus anomalus]